MKIAVFLPNWVGDAVMATPALRALRNHFTDAEILAVHRPYVGDVLHGLNVVDRSLPHDPGGDAPSRGWRFLRQLRAERADMAILLPNSLRTAWLAWAAGIRRRVGFRRDGRGWLLTDPVAPRSRTVPNPVLDEYLRLVARVGAPTTSRRMELATLPADESALQAFWGGQRQVTQGEYVCLNPGGAFGAAKHWPPESFGLLAHRIAATRQLNVLVLCGPSERGAARRIVEIADHPGVVALADVPLSLGLTKAAIRHARLLVTTDSGPRHFAPAFDVPVVTLFGPTHIAWSENHYERATHLQLDVDCGPCQQRLCPEGHHKCMRNLSVDQVFAAVESRLSADATKPTWAA